MDGGSSYGVVFNGDGAAVVGIGSRVTDTANVNISNLEIFGVYNQVIEKMKVSINQVGASRLILFDTIDWIAVTDSLADGATARYIGDAYTDVLLAMKLSVDSWSFLNSLYVTWAELRYALEGASLRAIWDGSSPADNDQNADGCNTDIQLHSSKGAIGLRIDGTQNVRIDGLRIGDVVNWAALGAQWCGASHGPAVSNEDRDIQYGYTGTRATGMVADYATGTVQNVHINGVESLHGEAVGLNVYKHCDLQVLGGAASLQIGAVRAGSNLSEQAVQKLALPNLRPHACALYVHDEASLDLLDAEALNASDIEGFAGCPDGDKQAAADTAAMDSSVFEVALLSIALICVVVCCLRIIKRCCEKRRDEEEESEQVDGASDDSDDTVLLTQSESEYTPLLTLYN